MADPNFEDDTFKDFLAVDIRDDSVSLDQLFSYIQGESSIGFPSSSSSATCTPYNLSVASTPNIQTRQPHPSHSLSASTTAVNTITSANQNGFDNPAFVTDIKNSPRLPDSPPDSGSEAFSPESRDGSNMAPPGYHHASNNLPVTTNAHHMVPHGSLLGPTLPGYNPGGMHHNNQGIMSVSGGIPQGISMQLPPQPGMENGIMLPYIPTSSSTDPVGLGNFQGAASSFTSHRNKKRKHSLTPDSTINPAMLNDMGIKREPPDVNSEPPYNYTQQVPSDQFDQPSGDGMPYTNTVYQSLKWQPYEQSQWHKLYDRNYKELAMPTFRVEADKGFNFAVPDDAFVCQKKNHFQVTVHIGVTATPVYVKTESGSTTPVKFFQLSLRGIKVEAINSNIKVEQSQADRSKKEFQPIRMDIRANEITKATVGRLHFSETTSNNMRKKGKPNPDQRYFMLVVGVNAHTDSGHYPIASHVSERIIVRASNPGQFDTEVDVAWQRGCISDSIYHSGNVGIKTDNPEEALTVHGNIRVTGHIVQPSDERAKEAFQELDPKEQLKNIEKMRILNYKYKEAFADYSGLPECDRNVETGVVAQELQQILPDAVHTTGDIQLSTGEYIDNFLVVNKDRIYMESIGAVKELCRLNTKLEMRINEIEKVNRKLAKLKRLDSLKSTSSGTLSRNGSSRSQASMKNKGHKKSPQSWPQDSACLTPRAMQCTMVLLIFIMLFCVVTMAVLLVMEMKGNEPGDKSTESTTAGYKNNTIFTSANIPESKNPTIATIKNEPGCNEDGTHYCCCRPPQSTGVPTITTSTHVAVRMQMSILKQSTEATRKDSEFYKTSISSQGETGEDGLPPELPIDKEEFNNSITALDVSVANQTVDFRSVEVDDEKKQIVQQTNPSKRRKRAASGADSNKDGEAEPAAPTIDFNITSISTNVMGKSWQIVTDYTRCDKPSGSNHCFTYLIPVPVTYFETIGSLEVNTSMTTKSIWCYDDYSLTTRCKVDATRPEWEDDKEDKHQEGMQHMFHLDVGNYVNSTYSIRFKSLTSGANCKTGYSSEPPFKEYNFVFYRNIQECPAG